MTNLQIRLLARTMTPTEAYPMFVLALIAGFVLAFFEAYWTGYVAHVLWGWFLTPYMAAPSIYTLAGVVILIHLIVPRHPIKVKDGKWGQAFVGLHVERLVEPLVVLGCGWVWQWMAWGL